MAELPSGTQSMFGDKDGTTARVTKQFPHLAKEHSGVHREAQGKEAKTIPGAPARGAGQGPVGRHRAAE